MKNVIMGNFNSTLVVTLGKSDWEAHLSIKHNNNFHNKRNSNVMLTLSPSIRMSNYSLIRMSNYNLILVVPRDEWITIMKKKRKEKEMSESLCKKQKPMVK